MTVGRADVELPCLVGEPRHHIGKAELVPKLGRRYQSVSLCPRVWRQTRRTFEGGRRCGDRPPAHRCICIPFELRGDFLVATDGCHGAVPEPAFLIRNDFGQGTVHLEHFPRVGRLTHGRADEWVAEAYLAFADVD